MPSWPVLNKTWVSSVDNTSRELPLLGELSTCGWLHWETVLRSLCLISSGLHSMSLFHLLSFIRSMPSKSSQGYGFSSGHVWMWELTINKAEHRRIDAFELWYWRRLLGVPWTARRSNQPILKKISPGYSLEGLMMKLKLQYFGHLMRRADSFEKTLILGKIEGRRRRG